MTTMEEAIFDACLVSLREKDYTQFREILVSRVSTDGTVYDVEFESKCCDYCEMIDTISLKSVLLKKSLHYPSKVYEIMIETGFIPLDELYDSLYMILTKPCWYIGEFSEIEPVEEDIELAETVKLFLSKMSEDDCKRVRETYTWKDPDDTSIQIEMSLIDAMVRMSQTIQLDSDFCQDTIIEMIKFGVPLTDYFKMLIIASGMFKVFEYLIGTIGSETVISSILPEYIVKLEKNIEFFTEKGLLNYHQHVIDFYRQICFLTGHPMKDFS